MSDSDPVTEVRWHRDSEGGQLLLGVSDDRVTVAVTFQQDVSWSELERVLAERDRELQHFLETQDDDRLRPRADGGE